MIEKIIKWLSKVLGISFESPFEMVDNLDVFVKDRLNSMLDGVKTFDIATGYFHISGWKAFADSIDALLETGGRVRFRRCFKGIPFASDSKITLEVD